MPMLRSIEQVFYPEPTGGPTLRFVWREESSQLLVEEYTPTDGIPINVPYPWVEVDVLGFMEEPTRTEIEARIEEYLTGGE